MFTEKIQHQPSHSLLLFQIHPNKCSFVPVSGPGGKRREAEGRDRVAAAADQGPEPGGGLEEGGTGQGSRDKILKTKIV